jgi:hypothetical protein
MYYALQQVAARSAAAMHLPKLAKQRVHFRWQGQTPARYKDVFAIVTAAPVCRECLSKI